MKRIITLIFILCSVISYGTNYYVSNAGSDSADGLTTETSWKTLAKISASTFSAGDSILFNKGDVWREAVTIPSAGTSVNYLNFGSYGTGDNPKFYGSTQGITWTNVSGHIWTSATTVTDPYSVANRESEIYFISLLGAITTGNVKKTYQAGFANLTEEYDWTWYNNHIYVYATTDPDSRYSAVEIPQIQDGILMNNKNYLSFQNLDVCFYKDKGFKETSWTSTLTGFKANNLKVHHIGKKNAGAHGIMVNRSKTLIQNCEIYEIGRRGISIYSYPEYNNILIDSVTIQNNIFHDGYHTTGIDIASNAGTYMTAIRNVFIKNNLFYEDSTLTIDAENPTSVMINIADQDNKDGLGLDSISNVYIYNNQFKYTKDACMVINTVKTAYVYNNSFYGVNPTAVGLGTGIYMPYTSGNNYRTKRIHIANNVFYGNASYSTNTGSKAVYYNSIQAGCIVEMDYNVWYQSDADMPLLVLGASTYKASSFDLYKATTGFDTHSIIVNPQYASTTGNLVLDESSPAIDSGTNKGITTDYLGNARVGATDMGAFEYQTPYVPPVTTTKIAISKNGKRFIRDGKIYVY